MSSTNLMSESYLQKAYGLHSRNVVCFHCFMGEVADYTDYLHHVECEYCSGTGTEPIPWSEVAANGK